MPEDLFLFSLGAAGEDPVADPFDELDCRNNPRTQDNHRPEETIDYDFIFVPVSLAVNVDGERHHDADRHVDYC